MTTALLVVDLQNAFCRPEGSFVRRGFAIADLDRVIGACLRLVAHAEGAGWPVVYTRLAYQPDYRDAGLLVANHPAIRELGGYAEGSFDAALLDVFRPEAPAALVVRKTRYDPFCGTDLEAELRARHVDELVVCGVTTNVCVESTVRRAHDLDFPVRIVEDAMSSYDPALHRASVETMARHFARRVTCADVVGRASAAA